MSELSEDHVELLPPEFLFVVLFRVHSCPRRSPFPRVPRASECEPSLSKPPTLRRF